MMSSWRSGSVTSKRVSPRSILVNANPPATPTAAAARSIMTRRRLPSGPRRDPATARWAPARLPDRRAADLVLLALRVLTSDEQFHGRVRPGARVAEQIKDAGSEACYRHASDRGRRAAKRHARHPGVRGRGIAHLVPVPGQLADESDDLRIQLGEATVVRDHVRGTCRLLLLAQLAGGASVEPREPAADGPLLAELAPGDHADDGVEQLLHPGLEQERHLDDRQLGVGG